MQHGISKEPVLSISDISFSYTNEPTIKSVSLVVHRGDYVGIIGPNGGGKSTLLKLIVGLLNPQKGSIKITGSIGYVPQRTYVTGNFPVTVFEVVAMGRFGKRGLLRFPTQEDDKKVIEALNHVSMLEYKDRQIDELSGGQQQRVFIARALASEPEIIVLDEPTVGVDVKTQKQFYTLLRKLNRELNLTLIIASHELDVVAHEATEIAYINRSLVYYGNPEEFLKGKYFHELIGKEGLHHV
jgi:zinc transport system ATP-binding protein